MMTTLRNLLSVRSLMILDVDGNVKVRVHCHITEKYRGSAHRDCDISIKLNHKIPIAFHKLKNYDPHLLMQKLDKFSFKIMSYQMD